MPLRKQKAWRRTACVLLLAGVVACSAQNPLDGYEALTPATVMEAPDTDPAAAGHDPEAAARGKYLVELLGCGACHTDGALVGQPRPDRRLAGSQIGIAYSNPLEYKDPGVVFPSNLTPDPETGIGKLSDEQVIGAIREGLDSHGLQRLPVMPWPAYAKISDEDIAAILIYMRTLTSVRHEVPQNVAPGNKSDSLYVHFGVYRSRR